MWLRLVFNVLFFFALVDLTFDSTAFSSNEEDSLRQLRIDSVLIGDDLDATVVYRGNQNCDKVSLHSAPMNQFHVARRVYPLVLMGWNCHVSPNQHLQIWNGSIRVVVYHQMQEGSWTLKFKHSNIFQIVSFD